MPPTVLLLLAGAVVVAALFATMHFRQAAAGAGRARFALEQARAQINEQDALEWRAIAGGTVTDRHLRTLAAAQRATRAKLRTLGSDVDDAQQPFERYASAVRREFELLKTGDRRGADIVDEQLVDPRFGRLRQSIDAVSTRLAGRLLQANRAATLAEWLILATTLLVVSGLLLLFYRGRQRSLADALRRRALEDQVAAVSELATAREYDANHDALTGLVNIRYFLARLEDSLREDGPRLAVVMIDLDRFKEINDTLGHQAGNSVLTQLAPRLRAALHDEDMLARLGGDEFALMIPAGERLESSRLTTLLNCLGDVIAEPLDVLGLSLQVQASMGVALFPDHGNDADTLLRHADVAMYRAKADRSGHAFYASDKDANSLQQLTLVAELRDAIKHHQLVVHYQPKAELKTGLVHSVEALVRWQHPTLGLLPPDTFLPAAEQADLMRPLTLHVLDTAIAQCADWNAAGINLAIAVNLSITNLIDPSLPADIHRLLNHHGIRPQRLQLEITENLIMAEPARATAAINQLVNLGVSFSLDDFGTGYSSLAYLKRLNVQEIKIDRSFITDLATSAEDLAIVRSTIGLAQSLDLRVVAEGIEDQHTLDLLNQLGCDQAQGYFLSRPIPPDQLTTWLTGRHQPRPRMQRTQI